MKKILILFYFLTVPFYGSDTGYVYVLTNAGLNWQGKPLVKIGYTKAGRGGYPGIEKRLRELDNTSVPFPFYEYYKCQTVNYKKLEKIMHNHFREFRVNPKKEYFLIDPEEVKKALQESANVRSCNF